MREYRVALAAVACTFLLLVLGGLVNSTGAALACPSWPLCGDDGTPAAERGALLQQAHRAAAAIGAALVAAVAALAWRRGRAARALAVAALAAVAGQAALGALAVTLKLPPAITAGHLALSVALLGILVALAHALRPPAPAATAPRALVGVAAGTALASILLGAAVRHGGATFACGPDGLLCRGALWPVVDGLAPVHLAHRAVAGALAVLTVLAVIAPARAALRARDGSRALLAYGALALVLAQVALGQWTLASGLSPVIATAHLATGAALLADLLALFLSLGPARAAAGEQLPIS